MFFSPTDKKINSGRHSKIINNTGALTSNS